MRYAAAKVGEDPKFIKHPSGWLNAKRWLDEPDAPHDTRSPIQKAIADQFAEITEPSSSFLDQSAEEISS
jgi:hypothetical protein